MGWVLAGIVALVVLVLLAVQTPWVKERIRGELVTVANEAIDGEIAVERLSGSLLWSATLEGVRIQDGRDRPFARLRRLHVEYSLLSLLGGGFDIGTVEIEDPRILLRRYPDGSLNVISLIPPEEQQPEIDPSEFEIRVDNYQLTGGRMIWEDEQGVGERADEIAPIGRIIDRMADRDTPPETTQPIDDLRARLREFDVDPWELPAVAVVDELELGGSLLIRGSDRIRTHLEHLTARVDADTLPDSLHPSVESLRAQYGPDGAGLELEEFTLGDRFRVSGVRADVEFEVDESGAIAPGAYHADVESIRVDRRLVNPFLPVGELLVDIETEIEVGGRLERTSIHTSTTLGDAGSVQLSGEVGLTGEEPEYRAALRASEMDLEAVGEFGQPPGRFDAALLVDGRGVTPETAEVDLRAAMWDASIASIPIRRLHTEATWQNSTATLHYFALDSPQLQARASGEAGLDGKFSVRAASRTPEEPLSSGDIAVDDLPDFEIGRADVSFAAAGRVDPEAESPVKLVEWARLKSEWNVRQLEGFGVRVGASEGNVDLDFGAGDGTATETRPISLDAKSSGRGIRLPGLSVGSYRVSGSADGEMTFPPSDPLTSIRELSSQWSGRASAVHTPSLQVDSARFDSSIRTGGRRGVFRATFDADAKGVESGTMRIESAGTNLEGSARFSPAPDGPVPNVDDIQLDGDANVASIAGPSLSISRVDSEFDLSGSPTDPTGGIDTEIEDLDVAGRSFPTTEISVEAGPNRSVRLSLRAAPASEPDRPYELSASTTYDLNRQSVTLSDFRAGRARQMWELADEARLEMLPNGIRVETFDLRNGEQRIYVDGTYRFSGRQSIQVLLENLDLEGLQDLADIEPVADLHGTVGLDLRLEGTDAEPELELTAQGRDLGALGYSPASFDTRIRSADGRVVVERSELSVAGHGLSALTADLPIDWDLAGDWHFDSNADSRIEAEVLPLQLADIAEVIGDDRYLAADGRVRGDFALYGMLDDPNIDGEFHVEDLSIHGPVAGIRVDVDAVDSETTLHYGSRGENKQRIEFESSVDWQDSEVGSVLFKTDARLVEWGMAYAEGRLATDELVTRVADEYLELALALEPLNLRKIPLEPLKNADAEGTISGHFTVEGTPIAPSAEGRFSLEDFGWEQYRDIYVDVQLEIGSKELRLEKFRVEWDADEIIVAHGTLPLPLAELVQGRPIGDLPLDFSLQLRRMPLVKLGAVEYSFTQFQGSVAGYLRLSGTITSPEISTRFAVIDALFSEDSPGTVGFWMHADKLGADGGLLFCRRDQPILSGTFDVPLNLDITDLVAGGDLLRDGTLEANLTGTNVPVEQLVPTPLVEDWITDATGYLQVDLKLGGTWERLEPTGTFALEEGGVTLVEFGRRFEKIELLTRFTRERIALEHLRLQDNAGGKISGEGEVRLVDFAPEDFDGKVETEDFDAGSLVAGMTALVTSKVDLEGKFRETEHEIGVDVRELNVELPETQPSGTHPIALSEDVVIVARGEENATKEVDEFLATGAAGTQLTRANVDIKVGRDSYIRHPNGFLRFEADLGANLQGTRVLLDGQVDAIKGDFEFLGRDFRVDRKEGIVRFSGAHPPNPRLDLVAIHPLDRSIAAQLDARAQDNPRIFIRVRGTAREPTLDMTSEPTMTESEIIFVLMTGRPPSNAESGQEEGVASQAAAAAGGLFAGLLQQKISKTVPVDVLRFESGSSGLQGSKLRVGKYITSDLFVSSAYQFSQDEREGGWETRVEYHFVPRWMVEAVYGEQQTGALNIFWDVY